MSTEALAQTVDAWLQPLAGDAPCGADLESDNEYLDLTKALAGKPETQFSEAVPPDFRNVRAIAESLFNRTRDLRVAIAWARAGVRLEGITALPHGLRLMHGLLDTFPEPLHPVADPDDGSLYARANALAELREASGLFGDLRQAELLSDRALGKVRVRAVEIALGTLTAREGEDALSREQVRQLFEVSSATADVAAALDAAQQGLANLGTVLGNQLDTQSVPDLAPIRSTLAAVQSLLPQAAAAEPEAGGADESGAGGDTPSASRAGIHGGVNSRGDAVRAIDMVCAYLERAEPTNPAPLLLRRAKRLIDQNFLQLMKDLAPESLAEVAKIMGVDPESIASPSDSG